MSLNIAVCAVPAQLARTTEFVKKEFAALARKVVSGSTPADFAELKASKEPFMLLISGAAGHEVLKDLGDDNDKPVDARRIRLIYSITAGVDVFNLQPLANQLAGIPFYNAQGCYSVVLSEWVLYCMMYFNRSVWRLFENKRARKWDQFCCHALHDQKLVIVGYGDIGQTCGKAARLFGMNVTGIRRSAKPGEVDSYGVHVKTNEHLDALLAEADFVAGVLPGTPATKHFFNAAFFRRMKPSAVFINIGRGIAQSDDDLVEALKTGVIRGAAIDVAEGEPLTSASPLWDLGDDKLLISPHCADMTEDIVSRSVHRAAVLADEFVKTGTAQGYQVDVHRGY